MSDLNRFVKEQADLEAYVSGLETKLKKRDAELVVLWEGLDKVSNNKFLQYGHGKDCPVSESEHQYKMGVTDGHRLARTWAEAALKKAKEIRGEDEF